MEIVTNFAGANIQVLSMDESCVRLAVEQRDSAEDWFYWCFKVENAAGKTVTFQFESPYRVGYYGAAVSHDYQTWHWQYDTKGHEDGSFTYTFGDAENEVYFAHDMLYRPQRFLEFAKESALLLQSLCKSEKGRDVPYLDIGFGKEVILFTARHHACESTGNHVLEGVLKQLLQDDFFSKYRILCVPFVDFDGVVDGDQGKNRRPHDHNRDYDPTAPAIYKTTSAIRALTESLQVKYFFDFHSPWHLGGENDTVFIPIKAKKSVENISRFSKLWEQESDENALPHAEAHDITPDVGWNCSDTPTAAVYFDARGAQLSFSVETPYFCAGETVFSPKRAIHTGIALAKALKLYEQGGNQ